MIDRATRQRAIICVLAASALYTVSAALVKALAAGYPAVEMMFFRSIVVAAVTLPLQLRAGGWGALQPRRPMGHVWRLVFGFTGMLTAYYGYGALPLATNTALGFCMPLFLTILSVPLLGERVGVHRWAAILIGLIGTMIVVQPGAAGGSLGAALLALLSAFGWALNMVIMRRLTRTESNTSVLLIANAGAVIALGVLAFFAWRPVSLHVALLILAIAASLVIGQYLQLRAFRLAPIGVVAPFQYFQLISATIAGWLVWNEWPASNVWFGAAIVVASGLYVIWREQRRATPPA